MQESYTPQSSRSVHRARQRRRRALRRRRFALLSVTAAVVLGAVLMAAGLQNDPSHEEPSPAAPEEIATPEPQPQPVPQTFSESVAAFAEEHGLSITAWPEKLLEAAEENPEIEDFALNYPVKKDACPPIHLEDLPLDEGVPLLLQWDERWGYEDYAGGIIGLTGCGPTSLAMVSMYLLGDTKYDPLYMANFSRENGYSVDGNGSAWTLISEGGVKLGLDVKEIPLVEGKISHNLKEGNPIICIMGPGDFTNGGHYIVMTGWEDGKIRINDPNSPIRSGQLWEYDRIQEQIRNLWVCKKAN